MLCITKKWISFTGRRKYKILLVDGEKQWSVSKFPAFWRAFLLAGSPPSFASVEWMPLYLLLRVSVTTTKCFTEADSSY